MAIKSLQHISQVNIDQSFTELEFNISFCAHKISYNSQRTLPKIIVYTNQELSFCVHSVSNTDVSCQKNRVVVPKQRTASIPLVTLTLIHSLIQSVAGTGQTNYFRLCTNTSEMIHHHGVSLSKQETADLLICHGTQQDLYCLSQIW